VSAYKRDGDVVTLTMSRDQFNTLLLALGMATGCAHKQADAPMAFSFFCLVNAINDGNPDFTPYNVAPETEATPT
jgi:hypothetical protein